MSPFPIFSSEHDSGSLLKLMCLTRRRPPYVGEFTSAKKGDLTSPCRAKGHALSQQRCPGRGLHFALVVFSGDQGEHPGVWGRCRAGCSTTRGEMGTWLGRALEGAGYHPALPPGVYREH